MLNCYDRTERGQVNLAAYIMERDQHTSPSTSPSHRGMDDEYDGRSTLKTKKL